MLQATKRKKVGSGQSRRSSTSWKAQHLEVRRAMGLASEMLPHSSRTEDLIQLSEDFLAAKHPDICKSLLYTDVSQSASRKPWTTRAVRSITTSSSIYSHGESRILHPPELMQLLGFPSQITSLGAHAQADLLGECMSVPSVTLAMLCLIQATPQFWE